MPPVEVDPVAVVVAVDPVVVGPPLEVTLEVVAAEPPEPPEPVVVSSSPHARMKTVEVVRMASAKDEEVISSFYRISRAR
jgi:hypothetical protein